MMGNNKLRSRHGYKSFDRDTFYGWMCWCDCESAYFTARSEREAAAMTSKRNKRFNNRAGHAMFGTTWHMVHYVPGQHWVMPDIISRKERYAYDPYEGLTQYMKK